MLHSKEEEDAVSRIVSRAGRGLSTSLVIPAGHGKTEILARIAAYLTRAGSKVLLLTHTHAGVATMRSRINRVAGEYLSVQVQTIDSWMKELVGGFPTFTEYVSDEANAGDYYRQLRVSALKGMENRHYRNVIVATCDLILVDEYQDCGVAQHSFFERISSELRIPFVVFGDPMQAIFGWADPIVNWARDVEGIFPAVSLGSSPHRWNVSNPSLGQWIARQRTRLELGESISVSQDVTGLHLFPNILEANRSYDLLSGSQVAVLSKWENDCTDLLHLIGSPFVMQEALTNKEVIGLANSVDSGDDRTLRSVVEQYLLLGLGPQVEHELPKLFESFPAGVPSLERAEFVRRSVLLLLSQFDWMPRRNLILELMSVLNDFTSGTGESMLKSVSTVRRQFSRNGRYQGRYLVTRPVICKGLEFEVCVVDPRQFDARELYVAISRATTTLVLLSDTQDIQPNTTAM